MIKVAYLFNFCPYNVYHVIVIPTRQTQKQNIKQKPNKTKTKKNNKSRKTKQKDTSVNNVNKIVLLFSHNTFTGQLVFVRDLLFEKTLLSERDGAAHFVKIQRKRKKQNLGTVST